MLTLLAQADGKFLGLDGTAWTALGTITALALSLGIPICTTFVRWRRRPSLSLDLDRAEALSTVISYERYIRIPVVNAPGKDTAENVEIYVESIGVVNGTGEVRAVEDSVPMRLTWCHAERFEHSIPSGSFRLFDFGNFNETLQPDREPTTLKMHGESSIWTGTENAGDVFKVTLTVSGANFDAQKHAVFIRLTAGAQRNTFQIWRD